jgi:hypothetical protein
MSLSQWTPRRVAMIWVAGIALQIVLIVAPVVVAVRYAGSEGPRISREVAANNAHFTAVERADSISRAEQVAAARSAGNFHLRADGQTVFAVVGMPSRRPEPRRLDELRASTNAMLAVYCGAIPLALIALTLAWFFARRPNWRLVP